MSSDLEHGPMPCKLSNDDKSGQKTTLLISNTRYLSALMKGKMQLFILIRGKQDLLWVHVEYLYNIRNIYLKLPGVG